MNWLYVIISKIIIFMLFFTNNAFAGGTEVSRQNNMILFSNDKTVNFSTRTSSFNIKDDLFASDNQTVVKKSHIVVLRYSCLIIYPNTRVKAQW